MLSLDRSDPSVRARLAVLDAVAHDPDLFDRYVLKGGLALRLAHGSPRRSSDLDFSAVAPYASEITEASERDLLHFCHRLDAGLEAVVGRHDLAGAAVQRRTLSDEIPAVLAEVGYSAEAVADNRYDDAVEMQLVLSEVICTTERAEVEGIALHVPTLEDALADKLKALLQQIPRDTSRTTDVFDLWYFVARTDRTVDRDAVAHHLRRKSAQWPTIFPIARPDFDDPRVREHAAAGWDALGDRLDGCDLPDFDDAFDVVLGFVDSLRLPVSEDAA